MRDINFEFLVLSSLVHPTSIFMFVMYVWKSFLPLIDWRLKLGFFFLSGVFVLLMAVVVTLVFFHLSCFWFSQMPCIFIIFLGDPFSWKLVESCHFYTMFIGLCWKHVLVHFQIFSVYEICYWILEYVQDKETIHFYLFLKGNHAFITKLVVSSASLHFCFWSWLGKHFSSYSFDLEYPFPC